MTVTELNRALQFPGGASGAYVGFDVTGPGGPLEVKLRPGMTVEVTTSGFRERHQNPAQATPRAFSWTVRSTSERPHDSRDLFLMREILLNAEQTGGPRRFPEFDEQLRKLAAKEATDAAVSKIYTDTLKALHDDNLRVRYTGGGNTTELSLPKRLKPAITGVGRADVDAPTPPPLGAKAGCRLVFDVVDGSPLSRCSWSDGAAVKGLFVVFGSSDRAGGRNADAFRAHEGNAWYHVDTNGDGKYTNKDDGSVARARTSIDVLVPVTVVFGLAERRADVSLQLPVHASLADVLDEVRRRGHDEPVVNSVGRLLDYVSGNDLKDGTVRILIRSGENCGEIAGELCTKRDDAVAKGNMLMAPFDVVMLD